METSSFNAPSQFIQEGEVGPIPRADASTVGVYLGMTDLAAAAGPTPAEAEEVAMVSATTAMQHNRFLNDGAE